MWRRAWATPKEMACKEMEEKKEKMELQVNKAEEGAKTRHWKTDFTYSLWSGILC